MKKVACLIILLLFSSYYKAEAQKPQDKVGQLISLENYFSAWVKKVGIEKGFLKVSDPNTLIFKSGPVKAVDFYKSKKEPETGELSWQPVFAKISKSNDWGFTTGSFIYRNANQNSESFGSYLSVWAKNKKGVWKLALDVGINHPKSSKAPKLEFLNPTSDRYIHQYSNNRLQQREDVVISSDKLFSTVLKANYEVARKEFLSENTRLLFPGNEPIIGKKAVSEFWKKQRSRIVATPTDVSRAYSGELAYTYGEATITSPKGQKKYNYVRIWEVQPEDFKWNVILEIFSPLGQQ